MLIQGAMDLTARPDAPAKAWIAQGLRWWRTSISLLIGLVTPISASLAGVIAAALWASIVPAPPPSPFDRSLSSVVLIEVVAAAVVSPRARRIFR